MCPSSGPLYNSWLREQSQSLNTMCRRSMDKLPDLLSALDSALQRGITPERSRMLGIITSMEDLATKLRLLDTLEMEHP